MRLTHAGLCAIAISVSACSSSNSGNTEDPATYEELDARGAELAEVIDGLDYTDPSDLPTIGQVSYSGVAGAESPVGEFVGELTLVADFDPAEVAITGSIDNILCSDGCVYEGSIAITNGEIDRFGDPADDYTFRADLAGDITQPDVGTFAVTGEMLGDFGGGDYRYVDGILSGDITSPAGSVAFDGGFVGVAD